MNFPASFPSHQRGAVLIVSLILLLIMTMIGLASIRGSNLQEKMSANLYDRQLAFQAAESALREAEAYLLTTPNPTFNGSNGRYMPVTPAEGSEERWEDSNTNWANATSNLGDLAVSAQYIIEYMGEWPSPPGCDQSTTIAPGCMAPRYRITARASENNRAAVTLQTTFRP